MPEIFEPASHFAVIAAWVAGAVAVAYAIGLGLSWTVRRLGRRSVVVSDIVQLTRRPVRATLVVIAVPATVRRVADPESSWRGWFDHLLVIALVGTITWLLASLVMVAERRAIARFAGGDTGLTDADRHRRKIRTQVTVLRRLVIAVLIVLGAAAALMTFPSFSDIGKTLFASAGVLSASSPAWPPSRRCRRRSPASRSRSPTRSASKTSSWWRRNGAASRRSP